MTVIFRTYRYRHRLEAIEIARRLRSGELAEEDDTKFVMKMVSSWDFIDGDTGAPIEAGEYGELSVVQHAEVLAAWEAYMAEVNDAVKKTRNASSPSSSTS